MYADQEMKAFIGEEGFEKLDYVKILSGTYDH